MSTVSEAIVEVFKNEPRILTANDVFEILERRFQGAWKRATIQQFLYACCVNHRAARTNYPRAPKILYDLGGKRYQLYRPEVHGIIERQQEPAGKSVENRRGGVSSYDGLELSLESCRREIQDMTLRLEKCAQLLVREMSATEKEELELARDLYSDGIRKKAEESRELVTQAEEYRTHIRSKMDEATREKKALNGMIRVEKLFGNQEESTKLENRLTDVENRIEALRAKAHQVEEFLKSFLDPAVAAYLPEELKKDIGADISRNGRKTGVGTNIDPEKETPD